MGFEKNYPLLKPAEIQFSSTCLQYEFDRESIKKVCDQARKRKFEVRKIKKSRTPLGKGPEYTFKRAIEAWFGPCGEEYLLEYGDERDLYRVPDDFERALDCLRLIFIASDLDAGCSMYFGDPTRDMIAGFDWTPTEPPTKEEPRGWRNYNASWLFYNITYRCNLSCQYCYSQHGRSFDVSVTPKHFEKVVSEFKKAKEKHKIGITIGGGEPTLHPRLGKILAIARKYSDILTLSTNGTNPDKIKKYAELLDGVAVSAPLVYVSPRSLDRIVFSRPMQDEEVAKSVEKIAKAVKRVCLATIVTSAMKPRDVFKVEKFASNAGATNLLFLLYKPGLHTGVPKKERARKILEKILEVDYKKIPSTIDVCLARLTTQEGYNQCRDLAFATPPIAGMEPSRIETDLGTLKKPSFPFTCPFTGRITKEEGCFVDYFREERNTKTQKAKKKKYKKGTIKTKKEQ